MRRLLVVLLTAACFGDASPVLAAGVVSAVVSSQADAVDALAGKPLRYLIGTEASVRAAVERRAVRASGLAKRLHALYP